MNSLHSLGVALWQGSESAGSSDQHWLMIFVGIVALSLLINAIITLVAGLTALKVFKEVTGLLKDLHEKSSPIIEKTNALMDDLTPKIRSVTENVTQITYTVREKVDQVGETVSNINRTVQEANTKTRGQVDHVDRMVSSALHTTQDVADTVVHGIKVPIKQVAGIVAGLRVGLETLVKNFSSNNGRGTGGSAL